MNKTHVGILNLPGNMAFPNDKVLQIFTKLKRRADATQSAAGPGVAGTPIRDLEPNLQDLQTSAMNSYRLRSEVIKTDSGFEVV